ncbi:Zn-dependent threonine dehydrogenase [Caballeronia sordidicola]|uniref:Zn-dependent threonine dehydrogenase n=1 Tax=Caballeronia sordidicola TaxID=196367 RepID=A0A226WMY5_CABSO|nr:Zn-dependent threonine dehydrogenase [Caballeronia sordidicola]
MSNLSGDPVAQIMKLTGNVGVDCAIEAVGVPANFEQCKSIIAPGGVTANVGVYGVKVDLYMERLWGRNIPITPRLADTVSTPMQLRTVHSGRPEAGKLITHRFGLNDVMKAYETLSRVADAHALKVIFQAK